MTDDLSTLLHDAVADVEPAERLDEIRARTSSPSRSAARPWFYAAGATVLATAATVAAFAIVGGDDARDLGPMHHGHDMQNQLVAAYYVGDTPQGPRLFREFDQVPAGDPLQAALDRIERPASDPDYRTSWTTSSFGDVTVDESGINVELRVNDLSDDLAVQQVVYTLQAAVGERLPVWFWLPGQRGNAPYTAAPQLDVLSPVSISDPAQGIEVSGSFTARGRASAPGSEVTWWISNSTMVVASGTTETDGWKDKLYPWETDIDVSGLEPGTYVFYASTSRNDLYASGPTDTRTIVVR
jgi:hypothetical protein